jgi:two-component system chemotaxis response regulator CheB
LPVTFGLPILVVQHFAGARVSLLPEILNWSSRLRAKWASHQERPRGGTIYVALPDYHLSINKNGLFELGHGQKVNRFRPAADPLFESMAKVMGYRAVSVVLSGLLNDGRTALQPYGSAAD